MRLIVITLAAIVVIAAVIGLAKLTSSPAVSKPAVVQHTGPPSTREFEPYNPIHPSPSGCCR